MKLDSFTLPQRQCIESTGESLVISAGAGTGKTFTITRKVAWMMGACKSEGVDPAFEEISQLLAITFTRKAAGEIISRIRSVLRSEGLHEQALKVDSAWVSTIHGMCSRILRDHALDLGIDPAFSIASASQSQEILALAFDKAMQSFKGEPGAAGLFEHYSPDELGKAIISLMGSCSSRVDGAAGIDLGPEPLAPSDLLRCISLDVGEIISDYECESKLSASLQANLANLYELDSKIKTHFEKHSNEPEADESCLLDCLQILSSLKTVSSNWKVSDSLKANRHKALYGRCLGEFAFYWSRPHMEALKHLAVLTEFHFAELKKSRRLMDNDDLLLHLYRALEAHPEIAEEYREQFRLIMVDEFQDTSQIQVDIFRDLKAPDAQICTVGDAQQSIYRFRGADVHVFQKYIEESGAEPVLLQHNFRSHRDILAFSNRVFSQPGVFDDFFLELKAGRKDPDPDPYANTPRVQLIASSCAGGSKINSGVERAYRAAAIAESFSELREQGHAASEMVLLLGAMSYVQVYADALAAQGFEVLISGGSSFWSSPECADVNAILNALLNPYDDAHLLRLLNGGILSISSDELLAISRNEEGKASSLQDNLMHKDASLLSSRLLFARTLLEDSLRRVGRCRPSQLLENFLAQSGVLSRLQSQGVQGYASAANYLKALRKVKDLESLCPYSLASVARSFDLILRQACEKDKPGSLSSSSEQLVHIMTIHASKGLEFPIVALAEFEGSGAPSGSVVAEQWDDCVYAHLGLSKFKKEFESFNTFDLSAFDLESPRALEDCESAFDFVLNLRAFGKQEVIAEKRRCFYVGVTRAAEALILAFSVPLKLESMKGIPEDIRAALLPEGEHFPQSLNASLDYGGSKPASFKYLLLDKDPLNPERVKLVGRDEYEPAVLMPPAEDWTLPELEPLLEARLEQKSRIIRDEAIFSYSSISHGAHNDPDFELRMEELGSSHRDDAVELYFAPDCDGEFGDALALGLAFHSLAEFMVIKGLINCPNGPLSPDEGRICHFEEQNFLTQAQKQRLRRALAAWVASDVLKKAAGYPTVQAEVPFCLSFDCKGEQRFLNGEIDLLCKDASGREAFVVDYKSGGSPLESPEQLQCKHRLQALCYAEALFACGVERIDFAFVRVEQLDAQGQPQIVAYSFGEDQAQAVHDEILSHFQEH